MSCGTLKKDVMPVAIPCTRFAAQSSASSFRFVGRVAGCTSFKWSRKKVAKILRFFFIEFDDGRDLDSVHGIIALRLSKQPLTVIVLLVYVAIGLT